jgi:hypothetical protein
MTRTLPATVKLLHSLYIRGRHLGISAITATQVYKAISSGIRKNIADLYIFRLRNHMDMEAWLDEVRAIKDKDVLVQLYKMSLQMNHYGFLYVKLTATKCEEICLHRLVSGRSLYLKMVTLSQSYDTSSPCFSSISYLSLFYTGGFLLVMLKPYIPSTVACPLGR